MVDRATAHRFQRYKNQNTFVMGNPSDMNGEQKTSNVDVADALTKLVVLSAKYGPSDLKKLPATFEPQKPNGVWERWLTRALDQGHCGSCWSFATASTLSDRINILSRETLLDKSLSPLLPVVCNDITQVLVNNDPKYYETLTHPFVLNTITQQNFGCYGND